MAVDTAKKRASSFGTSFVPFPDGTVDADDRAAILGVYSFEDEGGVGPSFPGGTRFVGMVASPGRLLSR